jgi:hypothetical protein
VLVVEHRMLPLGGYFGPSGPWVASRHGEPSVQVVMRSLIFWLIGIAAPVSADIAAAQ